MNRNEGDEAEVFSFFVDSAAIDSRCGKPCLKWLICAAEV